MLVFTLSITTSDTCNQATHKDICCVFLSCHENITLLYTIHVICMELQQVLCGSRMTYQKHIYFQVIGPMPTDTDCCLRDVFYSFSQFCHVRSLPLFFKTLMINARAEKIHLVSKVTFSIVSNKGKHQANKAKEVLININGELKARGKQSRQIKTLQR